MTNVPVESIEWRDQSSSVLNNISNSVNLTLLEYTIPLVIDDLHGQQFTCIAVAGDTTYTEAVEIQVEGIHVRTVKLIVYSIIFMPISAVPAGSLKVETHISQNGLIEAGSAGLTLTCTVHETISGLTGRPSAHWMTSSGPVSSGDDITVTETFRNATTARATLTFSSLHTSHAGLYTCQGTLVSPETADDITSTSDALPVTVSCRLFSALSTLCVRVCVMCTCVLHVCIVFLSPTQCPPQLWL